MSSSSVPTSSDLALESASLPRGWIVAWSKSAQRRYYCRVPRGNITEIKQFHPPTAEDAVPEDLPAAAPASSPDVPRLGKRAAPESSHSSDPKPAKPRVGDYTSEFSTPEQVSKVIEFSRLVIAVNVYHSPDASSCDQHWKPEFSSEPPSSLPDLPPPPARTYVEDSPPLIYARKLAFDRLDGYLTRLCMDAGLQAAPVNAFQRWGFAQRSIQLGGCDSSVDPLVPMRPGVDRALHWELVRVSVNHDKATEICERLAHAAAIEAKQLLELRQRDSLSSNADGYRIDIIPPDNDRMFVRYSSGSVRYDIPINSAHYQKLKRLYELHTEKVDDHNVSTFSRRLFALLARYDTIQGAGYQAAVPERCFDYLREALAVSHEGFASPLNQYLPSFGSAFPDVDRFFGSKGSFFDLRPLEGAFESNPPFLEEVMTPNAQHVLALIHRAELKGKALCFVVVWPGWSDCPAYDFLIHSPFCRWFLELGKYEHTYKEGFQHRTSVLYRKSAAKSFLFVMATSEANRLRPVTEEIKAKIKETFR